MAMPKKPDGLKKAGLSISLSPALITAMDTALALGQSRSAWIEEALVKALKSQGIKIQKLSIKG